jgi:hypothetical protein
MEKLEDFSSFRVLLYLFPLGGKVLRNFEWSMFL